ncbi:MAG: adenosylcobalamin-dependent ribonucleoside-diphosphate reductase [Candidatus Melainabacteria bacterium]|nr:adenosylcobalamin-dependent ribonucleoside-diphosphate reductase [Candidatus Melainabacteria bacterium]
MLSPNACKVLEKRYLWRDAEGHVVETPDELFHRVAKAIASVEEHWGKSTEEIKVLEDRFYRAMVDGLFMPNSPTLMNAGKQSGQLSACFVLPVPDSLEGIFETCKNAALIHKTGGGTGFSFSRLRPTNDRVATTTGVASGPVSFMTVYDAATEAIRQGGTRRGANMGILNIDHPDIEQFIACKNDTNRLNNFNISVAVTDKFMRAVVDGDKFELVHPRTKQIVKTLQACELFDKIVENAHATGEPGIIFLDRINAIDPMMEAFDEAGHLVPGTEEIEATNPCGEQPLGPGDACNLGSINLAKFVADKGSDMDWDRLADVIQLSVRFLDDIVEANHYPLEFIARAALNNRRIGLGVMGWAEALIKLNIAYDTQTALDKACEVMQFIQQNSHAASAELAAERGTFPNWPHSTWCRQGLPMRNATVTTIAPTGTISIIAGTSSGIEPIFAISFLRRVLGGMELVETNPLFEKVARERDFYSEKLMHQIAEEGSIAHIGSVPDDVKQLWKCAYDISYLWHVRMQAAFQKYTDCAVSKTINLPFDATVDDVRKAYIEAYELGLKGITVYRDTSRRSQVLIIGKTDPLKKEDYVDLVGTVTSPLTMGSLHKDKFKQTTGSLGDKTLSRSYNRHGGLCPECGMGIGSLVRFEACRMCRDCGYTKC